MPTKYNASGSVLSKEYAFKYNSSQTFQGLLSLKFAILAASKIASIFS